MTTEIKVPTLGESVTEATVAKWFKAEGDPVAMDEALVELETDKVTLEVNAPAAGVLEQITAPEGTEIAVGGLLGLIAAGEGAAAATARKEEPKAAASPEQAEKAPDKEREAALERESREEPRPREQPAAASAPQPASGLSPAVRKLVEEHDLDPSAIPASGKDGRLTKGDVLAFVESGAGRKDQGRREQAPAPAKAAPERAPAGAQPQQRQPAAVVPFPTRPEGPREERVRMTRLRKMVAARLKSAQNTAAMLTTFNEVDMKPVMELRSRYKDKFKEKYGVGLGFMSFFTKAVCIALKEFPAVNAQINGDEIIYHDYCDVSIAVSTPRGLVVPVIRNAESLSFDQIEAEVVRLATRGRDGKLSIDEMQGGTFSITNGGVFGSMLSTPILNPPQSAILGMHNIVERPVVKDGQVVVRPIMYLALSYDHRIVDGRESVSFLVRVKELLEDPGRLILGI